MTRDDLEAALWRLFAVHKVTIPDAIPFVDALLELADAYAAGDDDYVTAARRAVLDREAPGGSARGR